MKPNLKQIVVVAAVAVDSEVVIVVAAVAVVDLEIDAAGEEIVKIVGKHLSAYTMLTPTENLCVRCGKTRVIVKTWTEKTENSVLKYTLAECPDKACQKIVDAANDEREEKRQMHLNKRAKNGINLGKSPSAHPPRHK